jgi:nicotinate-nucleotide adenylyltransferase
MGFLEKIIDVADYIEPHRKKLPALTEIRKAAYKDLDIAIFMILENSLLHLENSSSTVDPKTKETYDFYKQILDKRGKL